VYVCVYTHTHIHINICDKPDVSGVDSTLIFSLGSGEYLTKYWWLSRLFDYNTTSSYWFIL